MECPVCGNKITTEHVEHVREYIPGEKIYAPCREHYNVICSKCNTGYIIEVEKHCEEKQSSNNLGQK